MTRVLNRLGANAIAVYPSGGYTGQALDELIAKEHVKAIAVKNDRHLPVKYLAMVRAKL